MQQQDLQFLAELYNTLLQVHTQGTDSFMMTDCMRALQKFISEKGKELQEQKEE